MKTAHPPRRYEPLLTDRFSASQLATERPKGCECPLSSVGRAAAPPTAHPSRSHACRSRLSATPRLRSLSRHRSIGGFGQEETFDLAFHSGHMGSRARIAGMGPHAVVRWAANGNSNTNKRLERNCHGRVLLNSNSVYREGTTTVLRQKDCPLKCSRGRRGSLYGSRDGARVHRTLDLFQYADPDTAQRYFRRIRNA
jgi:hypothetical protein